MRSFLFLLAFDLKRKKKSAGRKKKRKEKARNCIVVILLNGWRNKVSEIIVRKILPPFLNIRWKWISS